MNKKLWLGRRPKSDDFEELPPEGSQEATDEAFEEFAEEGEEEDEEVDFDRPSFKRDQIWSDYAEDLDFDQ